MKKTNGIRSLKYLREFTTPLPNLSIEEKKVISKLIDAVRLLAPLYEKQMSVKGGGAGFYPIGLTKEEIEQASLTNPEILSPYTIVER
ncbi:MAG TPA: hypothetical protein VIK81_02255, partial [Patescibacteria group bacterium]